MSLENYTGPCICIYLYTLITYEFVYVALLALNADFISSFVILFNIWWQKCNVPIEDFGPAESMSVIVHLFLTLSLSKK